MKSAQAIRTQFHAKKGNPLLRVFWRPSSAFRTAIGAGLLVFVFAVVNLLWLDGRPIAPEAYGFSAEHGNIAAALVQKHEFADPFCVRSGPTAWMPPVYSAFMAVVFAVAGVKTTASLWILLIADCLWLSLAVFFLCWTLLRRDLFRAAILVGIILPLLILLLQHSYQLILSPAWFIAAINAAFLAACSEVDRLSPAKSWWWLLTVLCGIIPLTHVGSGLAALTLLALLGLKMRRRGKRGDEQWRLAAACLIFFASVGGWALRSYSALGKWYPVKSNGWFELQLAQQHTLDGVVAMSTIVMHQAYGSAQELARFAQEGERAYLDSTRREFLAWLPAHRWTYLRFVGNRLINALVFTRDSNNCLFGSTRFSARDLHKLQQAGLGLPVDTSGRVLWTSLDLRPEDVPSRLMAAKVQLPREIFHDWLTAHVALVKRSTETPFLWAGFAVSGIPSACLLIYLAMKRTQADFALLIIMIFYLVALVPNILVTHAYSHQLPHLVLLACFIALPVGELAGWMIHHLPSAKRLPAGMSAQRTPAPHALW